MPGSFEAAVVFALIIAPGFLFVRGYARRRTRSNPERDLYALGQAVVASVVWLAATWSLLGANIVTWTSSSSRASDLESAPLSTVLIYVLAPYAVGFVAASAVDFVGSHPNAWYARALWWTQLFNPPSAWDAAWLEARQLGEEFPVTVRLKSGLRIHGLYGPYSQVDLSPLPHQLYLETGFGHTQSSGDVRPDTTGERGIFIDASEIAAIYFKSAA